MGLLDVATNQFKASPIGATLFGNFINQHSLRANDFPDGLQFEEIVDGFGGLKVSLTGNMLPMIPFQWGGEQRTIKEHYPGNPEASVQILGPSESDIVIRGRLKEKHIPLAMEDNYLMEAVAEVLDDIRKRGNICKMQLGEFTRYGILKRSDWKMKHRRDFDYELTFEVISENEPSVFLQYDQAFEVPTATAQYMATLASALSSKTFPPNVPFTIAELINQQIGKIAAAVKLVTDLMDSLVQIGADLAGSANKAVGLVSVAKNKIFAAQLEISKIQYNLNMAADAANFEMGKPIPESQKDGLDLTAQYNFNKELADTQFKTNSIINYMALIASVLSSIKYTIPKARYLVKPGDTLAKISVKFYGHPDGGGLIYQHNKLKFTKLESGTVLEIPWEKKKIASSGK